MNEISSSNHHRRSIRLPGFDYSQVGSYFITICAHERQCIFGEVVNEQIILSPLGEIAQKCWLNISDHFPNVEIHAFVIMPNRVHGILRINEDDTCRGTACCAPTNMDEKVEMFGKPVSGSIPTVIRSYKSAVSRFASRNLNMLIVWQRNYYEHVIKSDEEYQTIEGYIQENPLHWLKDSLYGAETAIIPKYN